MKIDQPLQDAPLRRRTETELQSLPDSSGPGAGAEPSARDPETRLVVIVPYAEPITGGVYADLTLARELASLGRHVEIVAFQQRPGLGGSRLDHLTFSLRLIRRFRSEPCRRVYIEDQALSGLLLLFNWFVRRRGEPVVLITHHLAYNLWRNPVRRLVRRSIDGAVARRADLLIAPSESTRRELLALGARRESVRVIPMGLTQRVTEAARVSRLQNGPVRLLTVGTVEPRKGLPGLIAALKALRDEPWQLDVVGALDEDHAAHLRRLIHHAGLSDRVRFHGRVSDEELNALLAKADIYVSPSRWEGFGLAVLEAMAAELPVVAIAAGAVPELIDDGRTGVLVPPDDTAALARAVRGLMADPEARAALGRRAGQEARARFNWKGTARMLDEALDALDSGLSRRPC